MDDIAITNQRLERLVQGLTDKELKRALRSTLRKEARRVRKAAIKNLRASRIDNKPINHALQIGRTIRAYATRELNGIRVDARFYKKSGFYRNSRGKLKPVAFWLQSGVTNRQKRLSKKYSVWSRQKINRNCGSIEPLKYMDKTRREELPKIETTISKAFEYAVERIAKKAMR